LTQSKREWIPVRLRAEWTVESTCRIRQLDLATPRRPLWCCKIQFCRLHVVENAVACPNDHFAVFTRIPHKPETRSELVPSFADWSCAIRTELRIAWIKDPRGRVEELSRFDALLERLEIERVGLSQPIELLRKERL